VIQITDLTHVNAALNAATIVLLGFGYWFIRTGRVAQHRACMLSAAAVSAAFLVSYLVYHFNAGLARFGGQGVIRPIYFSLLFAHVLIAVVITPLVPITLWRALSQRFDAHRKIARWTWPLWMYVGVSGVIVYLMAVHLYPYAGDLHAG
jgi:putative membrane protein